MLTRRLLPTARLAGTRFTVTIQHRGGERTYCLPPRLFYVVFGLLPILALWYLCATLYLVFRDEMLIGLANHRSQYEMAYQDRIATLRSDLERETSKQLVDQNTLDNEVRTLLARQAKLENRAAIVSALMDRGAPASRAAGTASSSDPFAAIKGGATMPSGVSAYAPTEAKRKSTTAGSQPSFDLRLGASGPRKDAAPLLGEGTDAPLDEDHAALQGGARRLGIAGLRQLKDRLDRIEQAQLDALAALPGPAMEQATRIRATITRLGLSVDKLARHLPKNKDDAAMAEGGPFVPLDGANDGSGFDRLAFDAQGALAAIDRLERIVPTVPLRVPLANVYDVTSPFGPRLDPFLRRPAMHTGIDLKGDYGAPVKATARGKVVTAETDGGYGRMVEIDHGNGLATRYAHLSTIAVAAGQWVEAGQTVGLIGSSGRATGPHLHYEVRIDGEPVDPARFLKAATMLASASSGAFDTTIR